jgi:hypothetical protein
MPSWLVDILPAVGVAVGTYTAIRADLAALRVIAEKAGASAADAHGRIDRMLEARRG